jgi:hypothetical protein
VPVLLLLWAPTQLRTCTETLLARSSSCQSEHGTADGRHSSRAALGAAATEVLVLSAKHNQQNCKQHFLLLLLPLQGRSAILQELYQVRSPLLLQAALLRTSACCCLSSLFEPVTPAGGTCACVLVHFCKHMQHVQPSCLASFTSSSSASASASAAAAAAAAVHRSPYWLFWLCIAGRCSTTSLKSVTLKH